MSENYHLAKQTDKNNATAISQGKRQLHAIGRKSIAALALFIFIMLFGTNIRAAELTIHTGTATNNYVPVYGFYADAYLKCEFVYPASDLTAMNGSDITGLKFYADASTTDVDWGDAQFQVFLRQYGSTSISGFQGAGTVVYTGALSIVGGIMSVSFNTPYTYNGGNLLVGIYCTVNGDYVTSSWLGESVDNTSVQGYSYSDLGSITATQRNFLPKVTFIYGGDDNGVCEGFEGATLPTGWTTSGSGTWQTGVGDYSTTTGTHTGARNALIKHASTGNQTYLISPSMDFSNASSVTLSFWYINRSWAGDIDGFTVYYRVAGGAWVQLFNTTAAHSSWTEQTIDLPAAALDADCQIGFKHTDNYGYGVGLDDVCFDITYITQCEDFESYSGANSSYNTSGSLPTGWTYIFSGTNTSEIPHLYNGEYARDGQGIIITTGGDAHGATNYVIMPAVSSIAPGNMTFNAWWESTSYGILTVGYITNPSDASTFVAIGTATPPTAYGSGSTTVGLYSFTIPSGVPAGARIAFELDHGTSTAWWSVCIDNICLPGVSCEARTANISGCSATTLTIGNTRQLTGSVSDGVGDVSWNSSDPNVATVSSSGLVTAVGPGTATITYTREGDGTYCPATATCSVTVSCSDGAWTIDAINGVTETIACGKSYCFYDSGGPSGLYGSNQDYTCSFYSTGTIRIQFLDFEVEGNGYDEFVVTGTTADGTYDNNNSLFGETLISDGHLITINFSSDNSVNQDGWRAIITAEDCCTTPRTINITDCPTEELLWGSTHQLGYTLSAGDGTVVWRSSDVNVATVSSTGLITAVAPGTATITAIIPNSGNYCSDEATCEVTVTCGGEVKTIGTEGGTSYTYGPVNNNYHYSIRQIIYDESELCPGAISGVAFHYATSTTSPTRDNVKIYMGVRESATFSSATDYTDVSTMDEVYSGSFNFTSAGWKWFTFTTPYVYEGEGSLVMMIVDNSYADWNTSCTFYYTSCTGTKMLTAQRDGTTPYDENDLSSISFGTNTVRPDTRFCVHCCTERTGTGDFEFCRNSVVLNVGDVLNFPVDGFSGVTPTGTLSYESSNPGVASIAGSTITAVGAGSSTISASVAYDDPTGYCPVKASYDVMVIDGGGSTCTTIGDGSSTTTNAPLYAFYDNSWVQMIYKKEDLGGCGCKIKSITFYSTANNSNPRETQIYISSTTKDQFTSTTDCVSETTPVWSGTWSIVSGENTFTLDPAIDYDCSKNLLISFNCHGSYSSNTFTANTSDNSVLYYYRDGSTLYTPADMSAFTGVLSSSLPKLNICFENCTSTPIPSVSVDNDNVTSCKDIAIEPAITVTATEGTLTFSPELSTLGLSYNSTTHQITGAVNAVGNHEITITLTAPDNCLKDQASTTIHITTIDATITFPEN